MDHLHDIFLIWLKTYGSFALFGLLALGIVVLPIPEEGLLIFAGYLMFTGGLYIAPAVLAAYGGAITGITMSYFVGRLGRKFLLKKYNEWDGLREKIDKLHDWFRRYGKWTLFFGYFVPGVRHFTGLTAGISRLEYPVFALFAYIGAVVWASLFLSVGYFFHHYISTIYKLARNHVDTLLTILILGVLFYIWYRMKNDQ